MSRAEVILQARALAAADGEKRYVVKAPDGTFTALSEYTGSKHDLYAECYPGGRTVLWKDGDETRKLLVNHLTQQEHPTP